MEEHDDLLDELRELSEPHGDMDYDLDDSQRGIEESFLGDDLDNVGAPAPYRPAVPRAQPCNKASMVCLRGPCRYLWSMTTRFGSEATDQVTIQRHRVCTRHFGETQLADQNIYECGAWWPRPLAWIPESLWAAICIPVRDLYEQYLKLIGYNFDWRHFRLDTFEWDSRARRGFSGPGGGALYDAAQAKKESTTGFGAPAPKE